MVRFKMVGRDFNSAFPQHRTWVVSNTPDFDGYYYTGLKSGDEEFIDVNAYTILNNSDIVDFNYPKALEWVSTEKVLPKAVYDSQLAIVDGYAYLFGGHFDGYNSDGYGVIANIFRADLKNPADWTDTGAQLPNPLACSSLAIMDGYLYLFGGCDGYNQPTKHVYSAPISNPLIWTDRGASLPDYLQSSHLSVKDGYVYLYGGITSNSVTNAIYRASVSTPLTWTKVSNSLPKPLYGSHLGIIDGYTYLFGGLDGYDSPMDEIYKSSFTDNTSFTLDGYLPFGTFYGQFFTLGRDGYIIAPSDDNSVSFTRIFQCDLDDPSEWEDSEKTIPGVVSQSQLAVIDDRFFLFGGNGSSVIFTTEELLTYKSTNQKIIDYGTVTRTQYEAASETNRFKTLGFPWWKTNYDS